jgi:hypothetical protein
VAATHGKAQSSGQIAATTQNQKFPNMHDKTSAK